MNRSRYTALFLLCVFVYRQPIAEEIPVIAVASNFAPVTEEISKQFTAMTGKNIRISAGASGTLFRQIESGAPFELFLSADEDYVQRLYEKGLTIDYGRIYAIGVLVLYIPNISHLDYMQNIEGMIRQIILDKSCKLAIANPELAPYGRAAQQVLNRFITANKIQGREILGENVGQTAQFALTGIVDAAFLPYSLAITPPMQEAGHFELVPGEWYHPINQRMVMLKDAGAVTREFYDYLGGAKSKAVIKKYGYAIPQQQITED